MDNKRAKTRRLGVAGGMPDSGFLRLRQIIGDPKSDPPIPALIPMSRSAVWNRVKQGSFPAPVKIGPRTTAWKVDDIKEFIAQHDGK